MEDAGDQVVRESVCAVVSAYGCKLYPQCCNIWIEHCDAHQNCVVGDLFDDGITCTGKCAIWWPKVLGWLSVAIIVCWIAKSAFCSGIGRRRRKGNSSVSLLPMQSVDGMNLQIVEEATVREGAPITSKKVGSLAAGEVVTVTEERQVGGHQRVCIGQDRWISSRISGGKNGKVLAEPMMQPMQPMQPMQQQMMQQPMVAPVMAAPVNTPNPVAGGGKGADLSSALAHVNLSSFEAALRELGVSNPGDVSDLEEADCLALGMKKLEVKRLMRIAE